MRKKFTKLCFAVILATTGCQNEPTSTAPVIGITSVYKVDEDTGREQTIANFAYVSAIAENGGAPVILPTVDDEIIIQRYLEELDGLVLMGGADIPPSAYGEEPHVTVRVLTSQRYNFERKLIARWLESGKPLLGVCLGMQFTNVVAGGALVQDIPSQVGTSVEHRGQHEVQIGPGSSLAKILGTEKALVWSNHHQAVRDVGNGLRIIAHSEDGVIEALERVDGGFGLFIQWHPEQMDDKQHRNAIYGALVKASAARK
ncbi:MAG: gamma-glutamyl-gamma-aminobutyrate hydrolase family protein [Planctomycetota bacterium]|jgi:putative glutamine amidotransferase